jgi:hypothetical protein
MREDNSHSARGSVPLVYAYLGNAPGSYARHSSAIASRNYRGEVILLTDRPELFANHAVSVVDIRGWYDRSPFEAFREQSQYDALFRAGFWLLAAERLFVLEQFMRWSDTQRILHIELDVMPLDLRGLFDSLDEHGRGVFAPIVAPDQAYASLMYINDVEGLRELNAFMMKSPHLDNEMEVIGHFIRENPQWGHALPSDRVFDSQNWPYVSSTVRKDVGLVDAVQFGHALFGQDRRNSSRSTFNRFGSGRGYELRKLRFRSNIKGTRLEVRAKGEPWQPVRSLHVHAKVFRRLRLPGVLAFYSAVTSLPWRTVVTVRWAGWGRVALSWFLSKKNAGFWVRSPEFVRIAVGKVLVFLALLSPEQLSNRERKQLLHFLPRAPLGRVNAKNFPVQLISELRGEGLGRSFEQSLESDAYGNAGFLREVRIFLDALERSEPSILYTQSSPFADFPRLTRGMTQVLWPAAEKDWGNVHHASGFWTSPRLTNRLSFSSRMQVIQPEWVREMFPQGASDVLRWAESGLSSPQPGLSALHSYSLWVFSHKKRFVRLARLEEEIDGSTVEPGVFSKL